MDPEKALTLYATLKAKIDARKKKRKDDAEKKRKKGVRKLYKRRRIKSDGSRGKTDGRLRTKKEKSARDHRHQAKGEARPPGSRSHAEGIRRNVER